MIGVKFNGPELGSDGRKNVVTGRYDGKDYEFRPGKITAISEDAATHILGYGLEDKTRALIRLGWLQNQTFYEEAVRRLDDFQFLAEAKVEWSDPTTIPKRPVETEDPLKATGLKIPEFAKQKI